jgi:hypothetical protein
MEIYADADKSLVSAAHFPAFNTQKRPFIDSSCGFPPGRCSVIVAKNRLRGVVPPANG